MRKKLTKKYAHHTAFYVDHAHIYIYIYIFKLLMQDWITLRGHEPLISFFKYLRSHISLNAKFHTLNDIGIFFLKLSFGIQHNILQFVFLLQVKIHMAYICFEGFYPAHE